MEDATRKDSVVNVGKFLNYVAAGLLLLITLATTVSVVSRGVGGRSYSWTLELSEYGIVVVTFLPIMLLVRSNEQIQVTIINEDNAPRLTKILDRINAWIELTVALLFLIASSYITYTSFTTGKQLTGTLHLPRWYLTAIMSIASLAWVAAHIRKLKLSRMTKPKR